ncbi:MAG: 2Fe-2S iron-sulfur cluster binding domain-containing protein [Desulfovibrio sp.]|nr:2Fe-2S iron-sulfur cluster binding domain-containing protein [Desulfovibrio sp.]MBR5051192.1 2Fe-2S iron-sulfur cluster binding domain-containing protein [Desulfovibrio sp.]
MSEAKTQEMYRVYIMGKEYRVPAGLTIMKAIEYSGMRLTHGCGCRGGVCGACATVYRMENESKWHVCLACQTDAADGMYLVQLPYLPNYRAQYDINKTELDTETLVDLYPQLKRCMGCNTCTNSCPMDLHVLDYVSAALQGDFKKCKDLSIDCIMCGMCGSRCPTNNTPMNMSLMVRRLIGKQAHKNTPEFNQRLADIKAKKYDAEIHGYMNMSKEEVQKIYKKFQSEKGRSV